MQNLSNVILDLDNTLISAEALEEFPFDQDGIRDKALKFALHDMDGYYIVFERPNLQSFLDWLFQTFNVSIWTAASKDYALFVIKHIVLKKPNRSLDYILFSHQCDLSKLIFNGDTKNLRLLFEVFKMDGYDGSNTLIIDDLDTVYYSQPDNCINIKEFNILDSGSEKDNELENVKNKLKVIING